MDRMMLTQIAEKIYQRMFWYESHRMNCKNSLLHSITLYDLQLKKHTQTDTIPEDCFLNWTKFLQDSEKKLVIAR